MIIYYLVVFGGTLALALLFGWSQWTDGRDPDAHAAALMRILNTYEARVTMGDARPGRSTHKT